MNDQQFSTFEIRAGSGEKMDTQVILRDSGDKNSPFRLVFESPVRNLFRRAQDRTVDGLLGDFFGTTEQDSLPRGLEIFIEDNQGMDFVIRARLRAVLENYLKPKEEK